MSQQGPELGRGNGNEHEGMDAHVLVHIRDLETGWKKVLKQEESENEAEQVWGGIELLIWTY